jgi:hypothetical protein
LEHQVIGVWYYNHILGSNGLIVYRHYTVGQLLPTDHAPYIVIYGKTSANRISCILEQYDCII